MTANQNLCQMGYMTARFLKTGDIIERHSRIYEVTDTPVTKSNVRFGHIVIVCKNEEGGFEALSMPAGVLVPLYDALNDAEWKAAAGRFA